MALYRWPLEAPRATCLLIHGYAEHTGRYGALADALRAAVIEVRAIDLRVHGRSPGPRADVRLFADYIDDVSRLADRIEAERAGLPHVVLGHSMGGAIGLRFALEGPRPPAALVLSSPFLRPAVPPPSWMSGLAAGLASTLPRLPVQPLDAKALSRDPAVVEAYRRDPLTYTGWVKARMGHELVRSGPPLLERASALQPPTFIVHGSADALADPGASRELAAAVGDGRVTLKIYDGGYHELFNDLEREVVTADLLAWLDEQLPPGSER
ncbi:MAG: lysophospholipase [Deinococcales bacterium]